MWGRGSKTGKADRDGGANPGFPLKPTPAASGEDSGSGFTKSVFCLC